MITNVQILGVEGSAETDKLRDNVQLALDQLGMSANVEHVAGLDNFMKYKINGIPALIINETVVFQRSVPKVEEIKALLRVFYESGTKPFALGKILVPTDFSNVSKGAFHFACQLAALKEGEIKLINVHLPEYDPNNPYIRKPLESLLESATERLEKFIGNRKSKIPEGVDIRTEVNVGFPVEEIVRQSIVEESDLIVMGTTGDKGFLEKVFGSVSTSVAQRAKCPVVMIPDGVSFKGFKRIIYACDYDGANERTVTKLMDIAKLFEAEVHFIHVADPSRDKDYTSIKKRLTDIFNRLGEPGFPCNISKIEGVSVADSLNEYALKNRIDLVVLVKPHRSFWDNIFHRSVTKAMTLNTTLPILVLKE